MTVRPAPHPVVLIHGTRTSHSQWDLQRPGLEAAGHRTTAPDLPGHGARHTEPFTLDAAAEVISQAVRVAAEDGPTHLVGSSLGGMLAIHTAARLTAEDPALLCSVIACGAAVQPTPHTARAYAALMEMVDRVPGARQSTWPLRLLLGAEGARAYVRGGRADVAVVAPAFAAVASMDLRADLARIPVPVTFLHGRGDHLRLHERSFVAAAPRGALEVLPYGNHMVNLVRPGRFTTDLLRVLARSEREG
ncbi:alpha/beta hydrolase [Brachybacterium sp. Marseille-Q7125]|uniref:alpha/beta fold hydrolase n=1 Tax=Brachybacterium sp. Marseille-Q7125 TaxID=2932815 RepID=UPI001FF16D68